MMWDGLDNRKFPRVKAACHIIIRNVEQNETVASVTENIGKGGFCTVLERPIAKMSRVKVKVDLGDGNPPIECDGKVVWMVESRSLASSKKTHDIGIEFISLSDIESDRLKKVVERYGKLKT